MSLIKTQSNKRQAENETARHGTAEKGRMSFTRCGLALRGVILPGLLLCFFILAGCGFRPLYSERTAEGLATELRHIALPAANNQVNRIVRIALQQELNPTEPPHYRLQLTTRESVSDLAIERDSRVTRANLRLRSQYQLTHIGSRRIIAKGTVVAAASYNKVASEFANKTARENALTRSAKALAASLVLRLSLALDEQRKQQQERPEK